jgi:hypothetical protein
MDKDRQIRFIFPPLFFLAFLWWSYHPHPLETISEYLKLPDSGKEGFNTILGLIAAGGAGVLVMGFLIGTISSVILTGIFFLCGRKHYAAVLQHEALNRLWPIVKFTESTNSGFREHKKWTLYATATFVLGTLPKEIQGWLMRRWSAFIISSNTVVGLLIVMGFVHCVLQAHPGCLWWCAIISSAVLLFLNGSIAWNEYMTMLDFQSRRKFEDAKNNGGIAV